MLCILDGVLNKHSHDEVKQPEDDEERDDRVHDDHEEPNRVVEVWNERCTVHRAAAVGEAAEDREHGAAHVAEELFAVEHEMLRAAQAGTHVVGGHVRAPVPPLDLFRLAHRLREQHAEGKQQETQEDNRPDERPEACKDAVDEQSQLLEDLELEYPHELGQPCEAQQADYREVPQVGHGTKQREDRVENRNDHNEGVEQVPTHLRAAAEAAHALSDQLDGDLADEDRGEDDLAHLPQVAVLHMVRANADDHGVQDDDQANDGVEVREHPLHPGGAQPLLRGLVDLPVAHVGGLGDLPQRILPHEDVSDLGDGLQDVVVGVREEVRRLQLPPLHDRDERVQADLLRRLHHGLDAHHHAQLLVQGPDGLGVPLPEPNHGRVELVAASLVRLHLHELVITDGGFVGGAQQVEGPSEIVQLLVMILGR
mmetsp:Transcript_87522/g.255909  ORF Transcript_87522/g.255909 Transcript_87522/m.255909 type:complete len:425 (+) Transcript_87522:867-2141(+)